MNLFWFIFVIALSAYVGAVHHKTVKKIVKKMDNFIDKMTGMSKRQRREDIRKKYGFDKTYDKYIA